MTKAEFRARVDKEGSLYDAYRWGLLPDGLDDHRLAELWAAYCHLQQAADTLGNLIWDTVSCRRPSSPPPPAEHVRRNTSAIALLEMLPEYRDDFSPLGEWAWWSLYFLAKQTTDNIDVACHPGTDARTVFLEETA